MTTWNAWSYTSDSGYTDELDIAGYEVEATDGQIGTVDEVGTGWLVIDTGPWILGRRIMIPAATVSGVDQEHKRVYVGRTKDEIKNSPPMDATYTEPLYRDELAGYYADYYV
jgi:hypothetical protein